MISRFAALKKLRKYRPSWNWETVQGSDACIHWNVKGLATLEEALKLCKKFDVAIQAGSNLGLFPKRLAELFRVVHTFEPDEVLSSQSRHNAPERNIVHHRAALGNSNRGVSLGYGRRDGSGKPNHEGLTHVGGDGQIPQIRIDDLALRACDFMYLDIEGYELFALQGAEETVKTHRPIIGVEINKSITYYGLSQDEIRRWFKDRNYVLSLVMHSDEVYVPLERSNV